MTGLEFARGAGRSARTVASRRPLRRLTVALLLAELSAPMYFTAAGVWAFRSGGAMLAAVLAVVALVPAALVAPLAAVVTDRARRERVMAMSLATRAAFLVLLACGMAFGAIWLVLGTACAASICARVFYPALAASLRAVTRSREELVSANAVMSGTEHVGTVLGPALAGLALIATSPSAVCCAAAGVALLGAASMTRVQIPQREPHNRTGPATRLGLGALTVGFGTLLADQETRALVMTHVVHVFAIGVLGVAVIQLALHDLDIGSPGLGVLEGALAAGGVAGGAVALGQAARHTTAGAVRLACVLWALPLCAVVALVNPGAAAAALALAGVGNVLLDVAVYTHVQEATDEGALARTVAALQSIDVAAVGFGSLVAGIALSAFGTTATMAVIGLIVPISALILLRPAHRVTRAAPRSTPHAAPQPGT